jgi:hypothetical protein
VLVFALCTLHALEVIVVATQHVGRDGQMLQILRAEGAPMVRFHEGPEGACPGPAGYGFASLLDCVEYGHELRRT